MSRRPLSVFRSAAAGLIILATAAASEAQGRVVGVVKDEAGQPIKGATLSLENPDASPRNFTATTDDRGRFAVIGLKSGEWSIVAQAPGFQGDAARLLVRATTPSTPALTLKRAPLPPPSALGNVAAKDLQAELRSADQLFGAGQWDQAIASYKAILARAPALNVINLQVAAAYRNKRDYDDALAAYNELLKADPANEKARVGLGLTYMEKGDLNAARDMLNQAAGQPTASREILYSLGEVESARGNADEAAAWYQKASASDPNWGKPLFRLGLTALSRGDRTGAGRIMQRLVAVDPTSAEAAQAKTVIDQLQR